MPQGPARLHQLFGDDGTAWAYLKRRGFIIQSPFMGRIIPPYLGYKITSREEDAIDYLFMEWDWVYDPLGAPSVALGRSRLRQPRRWLLRRSAGPLRVIDKYLRRWQMWWWEVRHRREEWEADRD